MNKIGALFFIFMLFTFQALADEPYAFKNFKLGDNKANLDLHEFQCSPGDGTTADTNCFSDVQLIGGSMAKIALLSFYKDVLMVVAIYFPENNYSTVRDAAIIKYGKPISQKNEPVHNRMGASFDSLNLAWKNSLSSVTLEQRASQIDESCMLYSSKAYDEELAKRQSQKAASTARDL